MFDINVLNILKFWCYFSLCKKHRHKIISLLFESTATAVGKRFNRNRFYCATCKDFVVLFNILSSRMLFFIG